MSCVWDAMFDPLQLLWDDLVTPQAAADAMQARRRGVLYRDNPDIFVPAGGA